MEKSSFSERLALAMNRSGVNQSDVARAVGVSSGTVSRWLAGASPRVAVAGRLAKFLNCGLEWLLEGKLDPGRFSIFARHDVKDYERISKLPERKQGGEFKKLLDADRAKFPYRLRELREINGLGLNDFARRVGYSPSYVSRLERGDRAKPSMKFLDKLTDRFGVNRMWLLYGEKPIIYVPPNNNDHIPRENIDFGVIKKLLNVEEGEQLAQDADWHDFEKKMASDLETVGPKAIAALIESLQKTVKSNDNDGIQATVAKFTDFLKNLLVEKIAKSKY